MTDASKLIAEFEKLWMAGAPPELEAYLANGVGIDAVHLSHLARIDQAERWRRGERRLAEDYLARFPELKADDESAVDLIYHEFLLRVHRGEQPSLAEFARRFPRHVAALADQLQFHQALSDASFGILSTSGASSSAVVAAANSDSSVVNGAVEGHNGLRNLGRYKLLSRVGAGSFGAVYRAHDSELDRIVAIKIPLEGKAADRDEMDRFRREARSAARLRHPSIVAVHEIGVQEHAPYLVSEFVAGSSLAEVLASRKMAAKEAAGVVAALADALHYAHEMGVIHRDVKPANIMLEDSGRPRLMDFGLARRVAGDATMTTDGQLLGTLAYMSPEQARGQARNVDGRSDIYSLGVILYQLLTGELPFRGTTQMLLHQLLYDEPVRPSNLAQSVPRDLETICMKAMAKQASRRFATARDMADDLRRYLQGEPIRARRVGNAERLWRWCRRKPALAGMTAAAAVLLMSIAIGGTLAAVQFRQHAKDAEEELYFTSIGFANRELTASLPNPGRAEQLLDACPPDRRNWEWDYLKGWRIEPRVLQAENSTAFRGIAYSNDGSRLAAACKDGMVRVWNLTTDEVVALPGHTSYVYSVAFSPVDSNRLASSGNDGLIRLWDVNSKQETMPALPGLTVYPVGMANCIAFSPDGQLLAGASHGGAVRIWEAATGNLLHELAGHDLWAGSVAFSRDGRLLATGDWQGKVQIWNPRTGEFLKPLQLPEHLAPVACLAFSPDSPGRHLAAGYFDNRVDVWDVWGAPGAENPRRLRGHTSFVTSVAFHPEDDRRLMSAGDDRAVKIWDVPTGREVLQLHGHIDNCSGLAFRPDGRQLASASYDRTIRLWNATPPADHKREELHVFPVAHEVWSVGISPDGKRVAAAIYDGDVQLWDAVTGRKLRTFTDSFSMAVFSMAFSPDGRCIAAAGFDEGTPACVLKVLDAQTGDTLLQHREIPEILATEFSPDGKWLAFGLSDGSIKVLSAKAGNKLVHVGQHDGQIAYGSVRFQPLDGTRLASASLDGTVRVWDLPLVLAAADQEGELFAPSPSKYLRWRMPRSDTNIAFWNISYSRDGRRLVTGNKDGQLSLWDAETGAEIATGLNKRSEASSGAFLSAAYSPNGRWIVSASEDCTVRVYDAQSFELVHKFRGHLGPIRCLAVSDEVIVTGGNDRTVRIWNLAQLQSTLELKQSL